MLDEYILKIQIPSSHCSRRVVQQSYALRSKEHVRNTYIISEVIAPAVTVPYEVPVSKWEQFVR
jgi:hypothetical protein